jgi:hypothetical protein
MKFFLFLICSFVSFALFAQNKSIGNRAVSPLALYSDEWNDPKYEHCNTAANVNYMNEEEKNIIYILNLVRTNPNLFAKTVLKKYPATSGKTYLTNDIYYYKSLMDKLLSLQALNALGPDNSCYNSAQCHASSSGASGYVGHERKNRECKEKKYYYGECCEYGHDDALDIVMSLLIDENVPSLGHRDICLSPYKFIGVSMQPHRKYKINTVLDFYY